MKRLTAPRIPFPTLILATSLAWSFAVPAISAENREAKELKKAASKKAEDSVESTLRFTPGDEPGNEMKALKTEMLVMKAEKKALVQLERLHEKYKGTRMEPDILFRLAELHMRRARTHRFFEVHRESEQVMSFAPTLVKEASENAQIRKAISIYADLQGRFPNFRNMDVVIFNTAYGYQQLGDDKSAETNFNRIVSEHARSPLVPDSYLAMGEINYNRKAFAQALEHFRSVRKYPKARVYPYGLYKAAWCHYNMQDAGAAMKQLEEVVAFGRLVAEKKMDSKLDLRKEALNDMATFYGDVAPAGRAVDYFMKQAQGLDAAPVLLRLAGLYKRHSRFQDIEVMLKEMLNRMPKSERVPTVHEELVWNYEALRQRADAVTQLTEFNSYCRTLPKASKAKKGEAPMDPMGDCLAKIAEASKKLATKWHATWKKKNPTPDLATSAEHAYGIYLQNGAAAKDPELAQIRYQYAEILFQLKKYRDASAQYALVQSANPAEQLGHDAAYGAVVALEKANENKWSDDDEKLFRKLSDVYLSKHSKGAYVLELQFKRAFIAYEKNRFEEAASGFRQIGWNNPVNDQTRERVQKAQDLYLDILNHKKDYAGLKAAADSLVRNGIVEGPRLQAVEKIYREAYFAEIQQLEEKGENAGAIALYKKFALENKQSDLASKAWWNASQLQFKIGDAQGGAETCYQMHKLFPSSPMGKDCLTKAAQTYEATGRLEPAARVLLNLAMVDDKQAVKWRELSADFFALSGQRDRAIEMYVKLAEGEKTSTRQLALYEKALELQKLDNDTPGYQKTQAKVMALGLEPASSAAQLEQAEGLLTKGKHEEAFAMTRKILGRSLPKNFLARARLVQARILDDEFRKQSVKARVDRIAMVLAIKTEKLEKAQRAFQETIKYGDPKTSVQALRILASSYMHYVQAVRELPLPKGLPEADLNAFKGELDALVIPMEEKGIDSLNQALAAAQKFELRDGSIAEIQDELNKANMKTGAGSNVEIKAPPVILPSLGGVASMEVWK